jgi:hypothetical protein
MMMRFSFDPPFVAWGRIKQTEICVGKRDAIQLTLADSMPGTLKIHHGPCPQFVRMI